MTCLYRRFAADRQIDQFVFDSCGCVCHEGRANKERTLPLLSLYEAGCYIAMDGHYLFSGKTTCRLTLFLFFVCESARDSIRGIIHTLARSRDNKKTESRKIRICVYTHAEIPCAARKGGEVCRRRTESNQEVRISSVS